MDNKDINKEEDAKAKYEKLCEIVKDIETNGIEGDHTSRQLVLTAVVNSGNEILYKSIEKDLLDEKSSETMRTVCCGILMSKGKIGTVCKYAKEAFNDLTIIDSNYNDRESFLLVADALVNGIKSEEANDNEKQDYISMLKIIYNVSCHPQSNSVIADKLLQRFINILACNNPLINDMLINISKDYNQELNSRLIAIDIAGRSNPVEFYNTIENLLENIDSTVNKNYKKMFMLDVLTKLINNIVITGMAMNYSPVQEKLNKIDLDALLEKAQPETEQSLEKMQLRIKDRVKNINKVVASSN